jgi:putative Mg2+ transporter-C (MgtC) family protein
MEHFIEEVVGAIPDGPEVARLTLRLIVALFVGGVIGLQREATRKAAGLRTHMLVALGTALFVVSVQEAIFQADAMSRVIQGIITGIGFLGAGAILKLTQQQKIRGLTTAAGIWLTAAGGVAAGLGQFVPALVGAILAWIVLSVLWRIEHKLKSSRHPKNKERTSDLPTRDADDD